MNPFDDEDGTFLALVNASEERSLWPTFAPVPDGWDREFGPATRSECLDWIERHWSALAPSRGTRS